MILFKNYFRYKFSQLLPVSMSFQEVRQKLLKLPNLQMKLVFFVHFVLISFASLGIWAGNVSTHFGTSI